MQVFCFGSQRRASRSTTVNRTTRFLNTSEPAPLRHRVWTLLASLSLLLTKTNFLYLTPLVLALLCIHIYNLMQLYICIFRCTYGFGVHGISLYSLLIPALNESRISTLEHILIQQKVMPSSSQLPDLQTSMEQSCIHIICCVLFFQRT